MNVNELSKPQQDALLDLALLGMYSDAHLASIEDARVQRLLSSMGFASDYDRNRQYDAAISRIVRRSKTPEAAQEHAVALAQSFTGPEHRRTAYHILEDLLKSDSKVAAQEDSFLACIRAAFQM